MAFKLHNGYRARYIGDLHVTIQRRGQISINKASYEFLGKPTHVGLQFDDEIPDRMGIVALDPQEEYAIPIRKQGHSECYIIPAASFIDKLGLSKDNSVQYKATKGKEGLEIDLTQKGVVVSSPRYGQQDKNVDHTSRRKTTTSEAIKVLPKSFDEVFTMLLELLEHQEPEKKKQNIKTMLHTTTKLLEEL